MEWEKILANHLSDKRLMSKFISYSYNSTKKNKTKKMDKGLKSFLQRISLITKETNTNQNNEISSHTHTMATVKKNEKKC